MAFGKIEMDITIRFINRYRLEKNMKVCGIIAEYNPFHNGHKYQLNMAKQITGADYIVIVLSGNFTQRGSVAIMDKYSRSEAALLCGADLVIELPLYYAAGSAEYFSNGAISLLDKLGVVDCICFGSESGNIEAMTAIADFLNNEPDSFKTLLTEYLKEGLTYPQARSLALCNHFPDNPEYQQLLTTPNNILGIEYIKAIKKRNSKIIPYTNLRVGSDYHDKRLQQNNSSAIAIRHSLENKNDLHLVTDQMPTETHALLNKHYQNDFPLFPDSVSSLLYYKLITEADKGYADYVDVTPDISDRIKNHLTKYENFTQFSDLLKSKDVTYSRISRCLVHILLNIKKDSLEQYIKNDYVPYARMLAFKHEARPLLNAIKKNSSIPLLSKLADATKKLDPLSLQMLREDITASHIYDSLIAEKFHCGIQNEYIRKIVKH